MESILDLQNQSSLAKLLATENITVTHSKRLSTAYFDVKNRVLGLPVWKDQGKVVYDMLVGHEVSHALYTPHEKFEKFLEDEGRSHFDILNIVEDIRIERLIKLKYAGMPRIFNGAYKKLVESDFFKVEGKNIDELNFLDRLNLHAKIGPYANVPLSDEELNIYNKCLKAETFEDVIELYHEIKEFIAEEANNKIKEDSDEAPSDNQEGDEGVSEEAEGDDVDGDDNEEAEGFGSTGDSQETDDDSDDGEEAEGESTESDEGNDEASSEDIKSDDDEESTGESTYTDGAGDAADIDEDNNLDEEYKSETLKAFEENIQEEEDRESGRTAIGLMPLKSTIEKCVIPYKKVLAERPNIEELFTTGAPHTNELNTTHNDRYIKLKKLVNKRASVLAREFERRKASYQYSRAQESRNGTIDVNSLHKYKYDDQIFSTTMRLADAKSHGMIFFIDYSGSMAGVLKDVLEHTLNLIQFCKKVGIPFQVFSFTSLHNEIKLEQNENEFDMSNVIIAELFSSDMKKAEYEQAFKTVAYQILFSQYRVSDQFTSKYEQLGGTPLDHTLLAAHTLVNKFNKKHAVQKTNVVILSDGDSYGCMPHSCGFGVNRITTNINRKQYTYSRYGSTNQLVGILKKATGATLIGFFLPSGKSAIKIKVREMGNYNEQRENMKKYKKDGFLHATNCKGYDSYFLLPDNIEIVEDEFHYDGTEVANNRTAQSQLARSYAKHNVKNRQNRIILNKFAEMVA